MSFNFEMSAQNAERVEVLIYSGIGGTSEKSVKAAEIVKKLNAYPDAKEITVRLASGGGSIMDALAIYNSLRSHPAKVTTIAESIVASSAVTIFLAGDTRLMGEGSSLMIHKASNKARGTSTEIRKSADTLEKIESGISSIITSRTRLSVAVVQKMLDKETWFNVEEAIANGFATGKTNDTRLSSAQMSVDLAGFSNVPEAVQRKFKPQSMADLVSLNSSGMKVDMRLAADAKEDAPKSMADLVRIK